MLLRAPAPRPGFRLLTFELPGDHPAGRISVVGSFNSWTPGVTPFLADGDLQRAQVTVPADADVSFRYLGEHGWWFDEPDADRIDDQGSHLAPDPDAAIWRPEPEPGDADGATISPAESAAEVALRRRRKAEKASVKAAQKARENAAKAAKKIRRRAEKAARRARRAVEDTPSGSDDQE